MRLKFRSFWLKKKLKVVLGKAAAATTTTKILFAYSLLSLEKELGSVAKAFV